MVASLSVRMDVSNERKQEYAAKLERMCLRELVHEFISYLDYTEESESGRIFHPITIGSCRVLMSEPLDMCIKKLREITA